MELFIDTADVSEIKEAAEMGVIDGVTTNPSLVAKSGRKFEDVLKEIVEIVDGPVSAEVISTDARGMIKEAEELVKFGDNIVIKIPLIEEGLKAIKELSDRGVKTNVTLVFSPLQALLAGRIALLLERFPFDLGLDNLSLDLIDLSRHAVDLDPEPGSSFVNQIDGLVRQEPIRDVTVRKGRCTHNGRILDPHPVMDLVFFFQAPQNGDGIFHRGFLNKYWLETPLQGRVLFHVLSVLIQRGSPHAPKGPPG